MHITMIAGLAALAVSWLWRRSARLPLLLPAQKAAALAGALTALAYVLLAGFGVPAQRTLYMVTVVAVALWFGRLASVSHVLCCALGLVVLLDPWAVLWPGFWLSFGAVAVIVYANVGRDPGEPGWRSTLRSAVHTQYAVTVGLVPLTMLLFGQVSLVSPLANAVAIPLVSLLVTPLALAGSLLPAPLCGLLLQAAHAMFALLAGALHACSANDYAVWSAPLPGPWRFVIAAAGTMWLLAPKGGRLRCLGMLGWLPLLLNAPTHPARAALWVTAFDIGQGMALLVETEHHRLLYDTGPAYSPDSNGANRVINPYLKARGINSLDGVIITHSDIDHSGGALTVLAAVNVAWTLSSLDLDHPIVAASKRHAHCTAGQRWEWDGVQFEMLHPAAASYAEKLKPNARGCVLRVSAGGKSVLLAADIEAPQEAALVGQHAQLQADVLLAPHHGSGTSSTPAFLAAVRPSLAIFQVGYRNRYHHPKPEVYERYGQLGIERLRTDDSGAVELRFEGRLSVKAYRRSHARYWY